MARSNGNRKVVLMFKIALSPQLSNAALQLVKNGNMLTINGNSYDFSHMNNGDMIPPEAISDPNIIGAISKENGVVKLTILMPYSNPDADESVTFPEPIVMDVDGELAFNMEPNND